MRATLMAGSAAALLAAALGAANVAVAAPDDETVWEEGTVSWVSDGDTLVAMLDAGSGTRGSQRIRTIGVQAPEVSHSGSLAECGASQATDRLKAVLPAGSRVQTRSVDVNSWDDHSGGRIVRSLYARDDQDNWYDTSRSTISDGWLLWFPKSATSETKAEWAHNLEYRVLADDAAEQDRGLWSADLCGTSPYPGAALRIWAKYWGTEEVYVENLNGYDMDLSGWTIRDSAISGYRTLPAGTVVPAHRTKMVYSGSLNLNNLPADNTVFEGDAVFLMDDAGSLGTGNLRAWFPYPCDPDDCTDPLKGRLSLSLLQVSDPPKTTPSAPGSVTATATTDGSGTVRVEWAEPTNLGANSVTYTVTVDSQSPDEPTYQVTETSTGHTFTGLSLGHGYRFSVVATNSAGTSPATPATPAVSPSGLPAASGAPVLEPRGSTAILSWQWEAAGDPPVSYTAVATPTAGGSPASCTTTDGTTSCAVTGLTPGGTYSVAVTASLGGATRTSPATSFTAAAAPTGSSTPAAPSQVAAVGGNSRAIISWQAPDQTDSGPIDGYQVSVRRASGGGSTGTCSTDGTTSCVVDGLTNETRYVATVTATAGGRTSGASAPSAAFTPYQSVGSTSSGPTAAPPAAEPWLGGEIVSVTNTSTESLDLGGYGLWDKFSAEGGTDDIARYVFEGDTELAAGKSLLVHFGPTASTTPDAPDGARWLWTDVDTFINSDAAGDYVELANLNRAQVDCATTGAATCRGTQQVAAPSSPVGVTARTALTSVTVTWGAPISRGGTAITGYTATAYDADAGGAVLARCTAAGSARSCTFPGATGRTYYVEVTATNAQGTSAPSWRVKAVPRTIPGAPATVRASGTPGGLNVAWSAAVANGAPVTSYTAAAYDAATGGTPVGSCTVGGTTTGCTILGVTNGTFYVEVRATNRAGEGSASSPRPAVVADAGAAQSSYSKRRVTVRWDAPISAPTVTGYTVAIYTKATSGAKIGSCAAGPGATSCRTARLPARSKYYIAVTATTTGKSLRVSPRLVTGPPTRPSSPKITGAAQSGRQVVLTWRAPTSTGFSPLSIYRAQLYSKAKGGTVKASCSVAGDQRTCTTKRMKKGRYYAAVRVKNSTGWSSWSSRVRVRVR